MDIDCHFKFNIVSGYSRKADNEFVVFFRLET